jgi:hypothetical protein
MSAVVAPSNIEKFKFVSIEYFYHFLRFEAFPLATDEQKASLLKLAFAVPLRDPIIFKKIVDAVNSNNIGLFQQILESNQINIKEKLLPVWPTIVDSYIKESDKKRALDYLRYLLFFPIFDGNMEPLKEFIKQYDDKTTSTSQKRLMIGDGVIHHSMFL